MTEDGAPWLCLPLLECLVAAHGGPVERERLCREAGLPGEDLPGEIDRLRDAGYVVERVHPHGVAAYRLAGFPDRLYGHEVRRRLSTSWIGRRILSVAVCGSTNDLARELAGRGAPAGSLVLAEEQTAGRGRGRRRWHSPPGLGLCFSLVLRPRSPLRSAALLQAAAAVGVAHGIMKLTGRPLTLRWPNDVLMNGKKLAGTLVEAIDVEPAEAALVAGIGLNVNQTAESFPFEIATEATSLLVETGLRRNRLDVLCAVLCSLEEWYDRMERGESAAIADAWRPLCCLLGRRVRLRRGDREMAGVVKELSPLTGILLATPGGGEVRVAAEHVSLVRPDPDDPVTAK
ncbi:MAG: biotin--[acetyl-CoA-carboxylase] ligase [Planctomycetes bacterium]|jgi:BirA family biotin operon repressor/biotin-[acetyl-CoA-carboxylase] ligase|nr:biotin--[acetyl-CoA-carboxylase] ligase [Planctomycetota bacterium]